MATQIIFGQVLHTLFSGKFISQYALCSGLLDWSCSLFILQRIAWKHLYNQFCHYGTLEDSILKTRTQCNGFLFCYACLTHQLNTTPSKKCMSAVLLQSINLSPGADLGFSGGGVNLHEVHNMRDCDAQCIACCSHLRWNYWKSVALVCEACLTRESGGIPSLPFPPPPGKFWKLISLKMNLRVFSALYFLDWHSNISTMIILHL